MNHILPVQMDATNSAHLEKTIMSQCAELLSNQQINGLDYVIWYWKYLIIINDDTIFVSFHIYHIVLNAHWLADKYQVIEGFLIDSTKTQSWHGAKQYEYCRF